VLGELADARLRLARIQVQWRYIEIADEEPPVYGWSSADQAIEAVLDSDLEPMVTILGHPAWAATVPCGPIDLVPLSRFEAFVSALVERYDGDGVADAPGSPRANYWQIGNEPDFNPDQARGEGDYGSCFGGSGRREAYADMLRAAHSAAKAADPGARVIFGGLAYDRFYNRDDYDPGHAGPFDANFARKVLDRLYDEYGDEAQFPFMDAAAVHVYNDFRNNWDGTQPVDQELIGKVKEFRETKLYRAGRYDLRALPLMVTEASLRSFPTDSYTTRSEAFQADYPGQLLARAHAADVALVVWFSAEDHIIGACGQPQTWQGHGLLRSLDVYDAMQACPTPPIPEYHTGRAHEPKPAADAAHVASDALEGAAYDRQLSRLETGTSRIEAHRFERSDGGYTVVAFTDHGERIGARTKSPLTRGMTFSSGILPDWTGWIEVKDSQGNVRTLNGPSIRIDIVQSPHYVRAIAAP